MKYPKPKTKLQASMGLKILLKFKNNLDEGDREFKKQCEEILGEDLKDGENGK